jgi:hypothetical protein
MNMKIRVVMPDGNVRRLDSEAVTAEELKTDITRNVSGLPTNFILHYFDTDFGDYFTLEYNEDIKDKMTVKVVNVEAGADLSEATENGAEASASGTASQQAGDMNLRKKVIADSYKLPKFDTDVEMILNKSNIEFKQTGVPVVLNHGVKSRILTRLASDLYEQYTSYPTTEDLEKVAKKFVAQYEGVRDGGQGYEGWLNSLIFKMGNYRSMMRKQGSLEMSVHGNKRSKYQPNLPSARKGMKKAKCGLINWQPEFPDGEDKASLKQHKEDIIKEMAKVNKDGGTIARKMAITYAIRRTDINAHMPMRDVEEHWPALLNVKEVFILC